MKIKYGLILAVTLSTGVTAQEASHVSPPAPDAQKTAGRPAGAEDPLREPFATNDLAVVKVRVVNVRGQANINSEIVTHLKEGDTVTVLGEVKLVHPKMDEPSTWVRIALPPETHVWVNSMFVDTNHVVTPRKLNIRTGPGENYSVIGLLHKGDEIKPVGSRGDWAEIETPTNAFAYVAAHLLGKKDAPAPVVVPVAVETPSTPPVVTTPAPQPEPVPAPAVVDNKVTIAPPPSNPPVVEANNIPATPTNTPPVTLPTPAPAPPVVTPAPVVPAIAAEPLPRKRIVTREGIVGNMVSIQAPSHFKLESLETGKSMDYLYSTNPGIILKKYVGQTVLVTGEEGLDERWENTPVLTVQKIQPVQ